VSKRRSTATIDVTKPQDDPDNLKSAPPLEGTYKIKCYGPDGTEGTTEEINVSSSIGTVQS